MLVLTPKIILASAGFDAKEFIPYVFRDRATLFTPRALIETGAQAPL
jgi:hypothetical protein